MAMGMAGGVLGQAPLRVAVEASDWRTTMLLLAAGGVALSLAAWATVRDRWRGSGGIADVLAGLGVVARHPQTWLIALAGLGTSSPLLGFAGLWGVPFLETAYGLPRTLRRDADLHAVRRLGLRRAVLRLAVGPHRPAAAADARGAGAARPRRWWCSSTCRVCRYLCSAACAFLIGFLRLLADRVLRAGEGEPPGRPQRHRHRLRQHHGDGRGRAVPAAGRAAARPGLVGCRPRTARASTTPAPIASRSPRWWRAASPASCACWPCARPSAARPRQRPERLDLGAETATSKRHPQRHPRVAAKARLRHEGRGPKPLSLCMRRLAWMPAYAGMTSQASIRLLIDSARIVGVAHHVVHDARVLTSVFSGHHPSPQGRK